MSTLTQARDRGTEQLRDAPRNERLLAQNLRTDAAINNMIQGFIMFDAAERIVVCNERFIDMYGLSREIVKPGCFGLTLRPPSGTLPAASFYARPGRNYELVRLGRVGCSFQLGSRFLILSRVPDRPAIRVERYLPSTMRQRMPFWRA
jgi:PAS domain-containing protein